MRSYSLHDARVGEDSFPLIEETIYILTAGPVGRIHPDSLVSIDCVRCTRHVCYLQVAGEKTVESLVNKGEDGVCDCLL